jgi:hypothetical protein
MAKHNVAELLVDVLAEAGVRRMYGVSGDSLNGVTDAIRAKKQLQWIHVRHEETAAFAAGAEAHLTGTLAVCAGSCGPGNLHLINGLYDCHRSRVPVLAICRYANHLGRTLPHHGRHTALTRLLQPRIDGERVAAGHWGAGQSSGPSGRFALWRRRPGDASGGSALASAVGGASKDHRVQE